MDRKYIFLILCLLLLIPFSSATLSDFQVTTSADPTYFIVEYTPADTVIWYSINSSVNYADVSWTLYGTNDELYFTILNQTFHEALVADVVDAKPLTCYGLYKFYYFEMEGFNNFAAPLNITLNTSGTSVAKIRFFPTSSGRKQQDRRVIGMALAVVGMGVFVFLGLRKKEKP